MTAPTTAVVVGDIVPGRPARPGGAAYWARVDAIAAQAPPLDAEQRAIIHTAIWGHTLRTEAAA